MKHNYSFVAMPLMFELPSDEFKLLAILISQAEKYQSNTFFKSAKDLIDLFDKSHNNRRFNSALDGLKGKGLVETKRNFNKPNTFIIHFENFPDQIKKDEEKAENDLTGTSATVSAETASTVNTVSAETASTSWCRNHTTNIDNMNLENTIMNNTSIEQYSTSQDECETIKQDYSAEYINTLNNFFKEGKDWPEFQTWVRTWSDKFFQELNKRKYFNSDEEITEFDNALNRFHTEWFNKWNDAKYSIGLPA